MHRVHFGKTKRLRVKQLNISRLLNEDVFTVQEMVYLDQTDETLEHHATGNIGVSGGKVVSIAYMITRFDINVRGAQPFGDDTSPPPPDERVRSHSIGELL